MRISKRKLALWIACFCVSQVFVFRASVADAQDRGDKRERGAGQGATGKISATQTSASKNIRDTNGKDAAVGGSEESSGPAIVALVNKIGRAHV